jgi:uncharacterized protein YkwD
MTLARRTGVVTAVLISAGLVVSVAPALASEAGTAGAARCSNATGAPRDITRQQAAGAIRCLINDQRRDHGRSKLHARSSLDSSARRHTRHMKGKRCFAHECPGEPGLLSRVMATSYLPCGCFWSVGENIAWGERDLGTPRQIVSAWMKSPEHRANILNGRFQHIGVGVEWGTPRNPDSTGGVYTTDFGYKR